MIAESLTSNTIIPLRTSDTGDEALAIMNDFYVRHLPIVNNRQLLGLISEDDILEYDAAEAIGSYSLSLQRHFVRSSDHIYEVIPHQNKSNRSRKPLQQQSMSVDDDNYWIPNMNSRIHVEEARLRWNSTHKPTARSNLRSMKSITRSVDSLRGSHHQGNKLRNQATVSSECGQEDPLDLLIRFRFICLFSHRIRSRTCG